MTQEVLPTLPGQCRVYRRRWLMLAIFVLYSCTNAMHWIQFSIISNIAARYFNVSSSAINWTAAIFEACYIPFVFPAAWLLDKYVRETSGVFIELGDSLQIISQSLLFREKSIHVFMDKVLKYVIWT
jgi:FLVCR family feline leukemia virus subgroup C receptor-related protein